MVHHEVRMVKRAARDISESPGRLELQEGEREVWGGQTQLLLTPPCAQYQPTNSEFHLCHPHPTSRTCSFGFDDSYNIAMKSGTTPELMTLSLGDAPIMGFALSTERGMQQARRVVMDAAKGTLLAAHTNTKRLLPRPHSHARTNEGEHAADQPRPFQNLLLIDTPERCNRITDGSAAGAAGAAQGDGLNPKRADDGAVPQEGHLQQALQARQAHVVVGEEAQRRARGLRHSAGRGWVSSC